MGLVTNKEKPEPRDVVWLGRLRDLLVPDVASAWEEQIHGAQIIADMAVRLAEIDGVEPADQDDPEAITVRASQLVADLVEPAKSTALEKLGEGRPAFDIANAGVRTKFAVAPTPVPDLPSR